jgi:hypothetical protein
MALRVDATPSVLIAIGFFWTGWPAIRLWMQRPTPAWLFFVYFHLVPLLLLCLSSVLVAAWVWRTMIAPNHTGGVAAVSAGISEEIVEMILLLLLLSVALPALAWFRQRTSK